MIRFGQKIIGRNVQTRFIRFGHWPKCKKKGCFRPVVGFRPKNSVLNLLHSANLYQILSLHFYFIRFGLVAIVSDSHSIISDSIPADAIVFVSIAFFNESSTSSSMASW